MWKHGLFRRSGSRARSVTSASQRPIGPRLASRRLQLEPLERRDLLSVMFVQESFKTMESAAVGELAASGDWDSETIETADAQSVAVDTIGLYDPGRSQFLLRNSNDMGFADMDFVFGPSQAGWQPLAGDWSNDGTDTVGLYDPSTGTFYLRDSNYEGATDRYFGYSPPGAHWQPLAGDWDGDGVDSVGLYDPAGSIFHLHNSNAAGQDLVLAYGPPGRGWRPLVGDFDGDGVDSVGLYDPYAAVFYLRNTNTSGVADLQFAYGRHRMDLLPVAGDFDNDGTDTIGLYDPYRSRFLLRNSNDSGIADLDFPYGPQGAKWLPLVGDFDGTLDAGATGPDEFADSAPAGPPGLKDLVAYADSLTDSTRRPDARGERDSTAIDIWGIAE